MEFKKLAIKNFLSYFETNEIDFAETTTIVIGQNNTGKSKLFDAMNFAIYGRVYDTQKESWTENEKEIAALILNKHKINEALKANLQTVESGVSFIVDDVINPNILLLIERFYSYKLADGKYEYSSKRISVSEIDKFDGRTNPFLGTDAQERIKLYFSNSIKDFFLFQGEAASKIMQLQRGGNFRRAVKEIARLELFEKAKDSAEKYADTINRSVQIKLGKGKKAKNEHERLLLEIDNLTEQKEEYQRQKDEAESNIAEYKVKLEEQEEELSTLKEFEEYFKDKETLEKNRKRIKREIEEIDNEKSSIAEESVFYKVREKISSFKDFYSKLEKKGEVPPSIPQFEIKKALDCCRCTICNADLSEGTEGRKFAESRLSKGDTDKLGNYLRQLNYSVGDMSDEIRKVPDRLSEMLERKRNNETRKSNLIKDEEALAEKLMSIKLDEENSSEEKMARINELRRDINNNTTFLRNAERDSDNKDGSIRVIENQIFKKKKELESIVIEDEEIDDEDKIRIKYSSKLSQVMKKLFEVANDTAYKQVEQRANEFYKEMTHENAAIVGDIKIDLQTSEIYTVDESGSRILNINQGNRISIQLAVIAGILTVAQEQFGIQYPFVTDAPVSHLGGDNKTSTIKTMVEAFEQSIIIIKDDTSTKNKANDEIRKFINESSDIETAYELILSKSENISDQYTVIKKIKG
ncbi:AAA family ATPase [uncultured Treponema sp.]|uniref:AAA family ATPase n=1 Tax=uncultured Treponema sp. TaxID=162155 RepID=UPI00259A17D1|nr:AAA family ATPase [uncultured Treponema sp.]